MITPTQIIDLAYQLVISSPLMATINGGVYKIKRPLDSKLEDVTINTLSVPNDQLQQGVLNINIHVPNVRLGNATNQDDTRPNFPRVDALTEALKPTFEDELYVNGTVLYLQNVSVIPEDNLPEHFINFRIIFYSKNVK